MPGGCKRRTRGERRPPEGRRRRARSRRVENAGQRPGGGWRAGELPGLKLGCNALTPAKPTENQGATGARGVLPGMPARGEGHTSVWRVPGRPSCGQNASQGRARPDYGTLGLHQVPGSSRQAGRKRGGRQGRRRRATRCTATREGPTAAPCCIGSTLRVRASWREHPLLSEQGEATVGAETPVAAEPGGEARGERSSSRP